MKKKDSKPIGKVLFTRMAIIVWCLWFLAMVLLTCAVARDFYLQLESRSDMLYAALDLKDVENGEYQMVENLRFPYVWMHAEPLLPIVLPQSTSSYSSNHIFYGKWELFYGYQAAVGYYDQEGQPLIVSGDYLYFSYSDHLGGERLGDAYIDLQALDGGAELADAFVKSDPHGDFFPFAHHDFRLEGYFEGSRFIPTKIIGVHRDSDAKSFYYNAEDPGRETVTVYTDWMRGYHYEPGPSFYLNGKRYENVRSLLQEENVSNRFGLFGSVIRRSYSTESGTVTYAIYCRPIVYAMLRLLPVYLVSILLAAICLIWYKKYLRSSLLEPLWILNCAYKEDRVELSKYGRAPFAELQQLADHFDAAQQDRHQARNQVQQLQTALDYAKNAEQSRRKMISAIAHELKTPLAVIHGYAEGLQTGIAGEKRDKYLSVILEETEAMDAMVLEMLELSRLEAGKVQLSVSQFSLNSLARGIFEKLAPAAESKQLQVKFDMPLEVSVAADESRIGQVITNFATNAIKYTPEGGTVRVKAHRVGDNARFAVENDSPPLSEEALAQVWDSFYRADTARDRSGTGLGLAIARNIIHLHRGTCAARNTAKGVEFQFNIPR